MSTPKSYRVQWSKGAENDLRGIIHYIAAESPLTAIKILRKLRNTADKLKLHPKRGRIVPELKVYATSHYQEVILPPWRIIYRISDHSVYILAVIDSRRNVEDILLGRFMEDPNV